ncbi:hypothetical protein FA15DRAFT_697547 [Coprinopsis marcescibilis]|uniref:Uncharacterized protein n=1 Tax=Coprinopsis marcescibilis TaxID=230819 RepID=A0A5C3KU51_COPMA|nr:hypothetical protein FA15DRAFT_697547 [Coprinopsis marcescibilis]
MVDIPASSLWWNVLDLAHKPQVELHFSCVNMQSWMHPGPNPLQAKANGCPMYWMRVMAWSNNVSGNVSKQYNLHTNVSEQFTALNDDFQSKIWHEAYDCQTEQEVLCQVIPHILTPSSLSMPLTSVQKVSKAVAVIQQEDVTKRKKPMKDTQLSSRQVAYLNFCDSEPDHLYEILPLNDCVHFNQLLNMQGIDPHKDTPVEILHTWLLGNEKYLWYDTSKGWGKNEESLFAACLQSSALSGLTTLPPCAYYLVQYKNSLIGKHCKILQQLAIFHLHGLCTDSMFNLWKAAGELGVMIWFPEIEDMDLYLIDLQMLVDNLLDLWAVYNPMRIITKVKLHVLTHLVDDVRRFGPAILYSTEVFECWNTIFCLCSIYSNHLAPSKDISNTLADMECFKHIVSSGWWKGSDREYIQAGQAAQKLFTSNNELQ